MIRQFLFFPGKHFYEKPKDFNFDFEDVFIGSAENVRLHGWFLKAPEEKAVLFFLHGNAGNISHRLYKAAGWLERGISVFLLDYRGYGQSTGEIRAGEDIVHDARAGLDYLRKERGFDASRIILYGESLGTYPVIRLAGENKVMAAVLEAPFTSFTELAAVHYPQVPGFMMKGFEFSNKDHIENVKNPLFIIHGTEDEICPYEMAGELIDKVPEPKGMFTVEGGHHNDLPNAAGDDYWQKTYEFLQHYE